MSEGETNPMYFNEIIQILELIVSFSGLILVVVGLLLPFRQSIKLQELNHQNQIEQEKRLWRMNLLDEQISKYYGPISAILKEQEIIWTQIKIQFGRTTVFQGENMHLCDLSPEEQRIWVHFVDNYVLPMHHQINDIMRSNAHLAIHGEHDAIVDQYLEYITTWEYLDNQKRHNVPNFYEYQHPNNYIHAFDSYIYNTLNSLLEEKKTLMSVSSPAENFTQGRYP